MLGWLGAGHLKSWRNHIYLVTDCDPSTQATVPISTLKPERLWNRRLNVQAFTYTASWSVEVPQRSDRASPESLQANSCVRAHMVEVLYVLICIDITMTDWQIHLFCISNLCRFSFLCIYYLNWNKHGCAKFKLRQNACAPLYFQLVLLLFVRCLFAPELAFDFSTRNRWQWTTKDFAKRFERYTHGCYVGNHSLPFWSCAS